VGGDKVVSFVDVPGHERFVRNMLAGAHGLDAVVLVVAADESVMPQTREHFEICRLLGIPRGLVVLTKCDAADADSQALAEMEARELVAGSFLEGAPVLRVSARTGEGLDALRGALAALAGETPERSAAGVLRIPVDRVFTQHGFGTVVTGTVVSGILAVGDELEVLPSGPRTRARGLQTHGESVERAGAGSRVAVNLAGLEKDAIRRGDVCCHPGTLRPTSLLDVELALLSSAKELADGARVRVHVSSAEAIGRVRLLGGAPVPPGGGAVAQLRLERPVIAGRGDRLVLRSYSPATTIGGATVLDPLPPKRRAADRAFVERVRACADWTEIAIAFVEDAGRVGIEAPALAARLTLPLAVVVAAMRGQEAVAALESGPVVFLALRELRDLARAVRAELEHFHRDQPLRPALPREELRERVFAGAPAAALDLVLASLDRSGEVRLLPDAVAASTHSVTLSGPEEAARTRLVDAAREAGLAGIDVAAIADRGGPPRPLLDRVARVLVNDRVLERVGDALVLRDHLEAFKAGVRERFPAGSRLNVAVVKEMTGLSRKFVIPLLEYLDRERVTRRSGADRTVLG
jgi:selenocysteine-specific elongation factor